MRAIVKHENEVIAEIQTNHSMTLEEAISLAGIDINEMDGQDPKYNYEALTISFKMEAEETEQEEGIRDIINRQSLETAVFDADLYTDMTDVYYSEFEKLPEWLQNAIGNGDVEVEENWDQEYWGSDSVVQVQLHARRPATIQEQLEAWKDNHETEYAEFCNKVEVSIWQHMSQQENFALFDAVMRGK